uniref:Retrotransposon protein, putative, Ty1-copia subclass n=1 Tax=Oryza sativa subsp. japonica TaxID=39947 RepID=Q2R911_ORYSJ|nr:retrotransposon protein, putative, Ty1-copia subclass [Oryza sativa Japonica Group]
MARLPLRSRASRLRRRSQPRVVLAEQPVFPSPRNLRDKEFKRCDADEDYLLEDTSDTADDESEDTENDNTMNTIRTRIADALIRTRGG